MTLIELVDAWTIRHRLSLEDRRELAAAVSVVVDDGPLALVEEHAELAARLGCPTMHLAAHRLLEERLLGREASPAPVWFAPVREHQRSIPSTRVDGMTSGVFSSRGRQRKCGVCREPGHNSQTCPLLAARSA